jgi:hypothetical protein
VTIDGEDACKMFHHEIESALAGPAGTTKKLRLRRAGNIIDANVNTADLLALHP